MAELSVKHVAIAGMAACVPSAVSENRGLKLFGEEGADNFIKSTGIERRRIADRQVCSSDLCEKASNELLAALGWSRESVDCLVFVTQTPDYQLPATSCILQYKLGLSVHCYTLDISLGCSGWVYAMSVISALMSTGQMKRGLLLAGDTPAKLCSAEDKSTYPLFGDAGTVTAFEYTDDEDKRLDFLLNSDGSGYAAIIVPDGSLSARNPVSPDSFQYQSRGDMLNSNRLQVVLEGMDVFSFGISRAPESVNGLLERFNLNKDEIDYYWFHQANLFMNEKIRKKLKLPPEKVPYSLKNFGNTSCATIPLTMVTQLKDKLTQEKLAHVACGFGVGLSWGSVFFETDCIVCLDLIEF